LRINDRVVVRGLPLSLNSGAQLLRAPDSTINVGRPHQCLKSLWKKSRLFVQRFSNVARFAAKHAENVGGLKKRNKKGWRC